MSMACSVEARTPFLDHRLIEMVFSNPDKKIFGDKVNSSKRILKKIFSQNIKTNIWQRKKEGFNAPTNNWVYINRLYLVNYFNENLSNLLDEIIDSTSLISSINSLKSTKDRRIQSIFSIYVLNKWLKARNG
jgi:asparagine synthase (glutamine-hydrolysing)